MNDARSKARSNHERRGAGGDLLEEFVAADLGHDGESTEGRHGGNVMLKNSRCLNITTHTSLEHGTFWIRVNLGRKIV